MGCVPAACYFVPTEDSKGESRKSMTRAVVGVGNDRGCGLGTAKRIISKDDEAATV
jgi:hypothetical protein